MQNYQDLLYRRTEVVDGLSDWWWVKGDNGAWVGPHQEWPVLRDACLSKVRNRGVVVSAGGCCGLYPRLWAKYFETVITFEPDPLNFLCLTLNCPGEKIIKINAALGYQRGGIKMNRLSMANVGMHQVVAGDGGRVPVLRIDDLGLDQCDLLSLDLETYEGEAIEGAMETIQKFQPIITVETVNEKVTRLLASAGYVNLGHVLAADQMFVPEGSQ